MYTKIFHDTDYFEDENAIKKVDTTKIKKLLDFQTELNHEAILTHWLKMIG